MQATDQRDEGSSPQTLQTTPVCVCVCVYSRLCVRQPLCVFSLLPLVNRAARSEEADPLSADSSKLGHLWLRIMRREDGPFQKGLNNTKWSQFISSSKRCQEKQSLRGWNVDQCLCSQQRDQYGGKRDEISPFHLRSTLPGDFHRTEKSPYQSPDLTAGKTNGKQYVVVFFF